MRTYVKTISVAVLAVMILGCSSDASAPTTSPDAGASDETEVAVSSEPDALSATTLEQYLAAPAPIVGPSQLGEVDASGNIVDLEAFLAAAEEAELAEEQIAAMSDGEVDFAEHEQLTRLGLDCMRDGGLVVLEQGIRFDRGVDRVSFSFGEGAGQSELEGLKIGDQCQRDYFFTATVMYRTQNGWSEEEERERMNTDFVAFARCLESAGVSGVPPLESPDDMTAEIFDALLALQDAPGHDCMI